MAPSFIKRNGIFFAILFLAWMGIVFVLNEGHRYFPDPLPNEYPAMQAGQGGNPGQEQPASPGGR
jgi:hypothetical protein